MNPFSFLPNNYHVQEDHTASISKPENVLLSHFSFLLKEIAIRLILEFRILQLLLN